MSWQRISILLVALALWAAPVDAQIAAVADTDCSNTSADPQTCAYGTNPTAGNLLVQVISWDNAARDVVGITDTHLNTWLKAVERDDSAGGASIEIWCVTSNLTTGANTTSTDLSAAVAVQINNSEFSGQGGTCGSQPTNSANTSATTTHQAGSVTPNQSDDLVVFGCTWETSTTIDTPPAGYTLLMSAGRFAYYYKIKTDAAAENPSIVSADLEDGACAIALFNEASGAGAGGNPTGAMHGEFTR